MSSEVEVIPTVLLDWEELKKAADEFIEVTERIEGFAHQITFRGKSFHLITMESLSDFEVHSPKEYLEEKRSTLIDIEVLACDWKRVGYSYSVAPEGEYEDPDFVDLVAVLAEATQGVILNIQGIWSWSIGLATPQELIARSAILR